MKIKRYVGFGGMLFLCPDGEKWRLSLKEANLPQFGPTSNLELISSQLKQSLH